MVAKRSHACIAIPCQVILFFSVRRFPSGRYGFRMVLWITKIAEGRFFGEFLMREHVFADERTMLALTDVLEDGIGRKTTEAAGQSFFGIGYAKAGHLALRAGGLYFLHKLFGSLFYFGHTGGVVHGTHIGFGIYRASSGMELCKCLKQGFLVGYALMHGRVLLFGRAENDAMFGEANLFGKCKQFQLGLDLPAGKIG